MGSRGFNKQADEMILLTLQNVPYAVFNNQIECNKWIKDNDNRIVSFDTFEIQHIDTMDATVDYWIDKLVKLYDFKWSTKYDIDSNQYFINNEIKMKRDSIQHRRLLKFWLENVYKVPASICIIFHTEDDDNEQTN